MLQKLLSSAFCLLLVSCTPQPTTPTQSFLYIYRLDPPVLLVSGVYYPVEVLPSFLQELSKFSPATYVLDGARKALLEGTPTAELWPYIWPVFLMGLVAIPAGLWVIQPG